MIKKINKVILNYDFYSGKELYSDGSIEDDILKIVKENKPEDYNRIIMDSENWPIMYHLSKFRENIIEWIPFQKEATVLEIGSGCGALTGVLSKKSKSVTCIELSSKRSLINAYRNDEKDNIEIMVGNFQDIESTLSVKYDYITLIGVLEYAENYIKSERPFLEFLKLLNKHLNHKGKIIIAIENRFGLKYWSGCAEDHSGILFDGLEDYHKSNIAKTFTKNELIQLLKEAGFYKFQFYYPYPDYKFPTTIYSDEYLPNVGELYNNDRNFDMERLSLFDEGRVFDGIIKGNYFTTFSNSYLVIVEGNE